MLLVDYHNLLHRGIHPNKPKIIENPDFLFHVSLTMILNLAEKFGASRHNPMVLCNDSKPSWRHSYYTENSKDFPEYEGQTYKGNRTKDETIPWDRINEINDEVLEALRLHSDFHVVKVPLCEADDIIAVLAKYCDDSGIPCNIVSTDGDFVQSQTSIVKLFNPIKNSFYPEVDIAEYKKLHILLAGDDNIKNVKRGLGEKTVMKLLPRLDEELAINPEMRKRFEFNQNLIDFEKIPEYIRVSIMDEWKTQEGKYNYHAMNLIKLFRKYSLNAIGEKVISFKLQENKRETSFNTHYKKTNELEEWANKGLENFF